jgi:hypothetical protein
MGTDAVRRSPEKPVTSRAIQNLTAPFREDRVPALRSSATRRTASGTRGQTIWKIASASTTWAMKPTVKASVRNTGRPSV